jgi:hypothetical protein
MAAAVETEARAAGVPREVKVSRDREGAVDSHSPVSAVRVEGDSPAVSLSPVNAARAVSLSRVAADFRAEAASLEADKVFRVAAADSPAADRDSPVSAAFLAAKDSAVASVAISAAVIVGISGVAIADIIAAVIAAVATASVHTDMGMDTTPVTATMAATMAVLIATPMATMTSGAFGIQIHSALMTRTPTATATNNHSLPPLNVDLNEPVPNRLIVYTPI